MTATRWWVVPLVTLLAAPLSPARAAAPAEPGMIVLDDFSAPARWTATGSDGVRAAVAPAEGPRGGALRLDFDLGGTAGYATAQRALPVEFPSNFELSFYVRGDAAANDFQVKLVDASGDNVWWVNRKNFAVPREWTKVTIKRRQVEFAWGPAADRTLSRTATIEFVVAAGRGGGSGAIYVSELTLRPLPPVPLAYPPPIAAASSSGAGTEPARALDGERGTAWESDPAAGREQAFTVDFGAAREFGGVVLRWRAGRHATRYDVELSGDGREWRMARKIDGADGGADAIPLPEAEARFLRVAMHDGPAPGYALEELEVRDLEFGTSPNAFFEALARDAPRGHYPRGFSGEQPMWTIVGVDGGPETGLLSEDGALEVARGGFTIEPFVVADGRVTTWADTTAAPFLVDRYLPMPGVAWSDPRWTLRVTTFASGTRAASALVARYDVRNATARPLTVTLTLAVRPFQVNPPAQFLNAPGGVSAIDALAWDGRTLHVNGAPRVFPLAVPDRASVHPLAAGPPPRILARAEAATALEVNDPSGYASGLLTWQLALAPHASATVGVVVPLSGSVAPPLPRPPRDAAAWLAREQDAAARAWHASLDRVAIAVPASAQPVVDALRTSLAHILLTRDGPVLRPGTRSYARSWIRDGTMMAESLLRLGHDGAATDYLRWYAPHQFANGKVPCCVDARGADPVAENDSAGELLFLAAEVYRYTADRAVLAALWPQLDAAARYLETLRQQERTDANRAPDRAAFFGLMPASISHEGYSAKPMHSYWDDFWALKGYDAAVDIATALDRRDAARTFARQRDEFRGDLARSLVAAMAAHGIDYVPGAAELGDFDATSTTIAFAPGGTSAVLPAHAAAATFERYWREFADRRDGRKDWNDYTPYEIRTIGTFLRLGRRDRAHALLDYFMAGRRPPAWNQWPEVVRRDPRQPGFVGDMPHGWIASDFIRAALDLFAYERDTDDAIVVGAGVLPSWLDGPGIRVERLPTRHGPLGFSMRRTPGRVTVRVDAGVTMPRGGVVVAWPGAQPPGPTRVNGAPTSWHGGELRLDALPATVVVETR